MNFHNGSYGNLDGASGSLTDTNYHTFGVLWLGDGNGNFEYRAYKDGVRETSATGAGPTGSVKHNVVAYTDTDCTHDTHTYIKYVKVLSCSSWNGLGSTGTCPVSPLP
jgi:hypothetical protein